MHTLKFIIAAPFLFIGTALLGIGMWIYNDDLVEPFDGNKSLGRGL